MMVKYVTAHHLTNADGQTFARSFGYRFTEVSAKAFINEDKVFHDLIREILAKNLAGEDSVVRRNPIAGWRRLTSRKRLRSCVVI